MIHLLRELEYFAVHRHWFCVARWLTRRGLWLEQMRDAVRGWRRVL